MLRGSTARFSFPVCGFAAIAAITMPACVAGGGSGGGGAGGGGASNVVAAGAEGEKCDPKVASGGCNGQKPMQCVADTDPANAVGGKWTPAGAECQPPTVCSAVYDATIKATKAECKASSATNPGTDTATTGQDATSGGGDGVVTADGTVSVPDGTSSGDGTGLDINVSDIVKCMQAKCASQVTACKADPVCAASYKCIEGCKDIACLAKCPQPPETNAAASALQVCSSKQQCVPGATTPVCGNGTCEPGETASTCAQDCKGAVCGNNVCEAPGENAETCAKDCKSSGPVCGNGACESGETPSNCSADCKTTTGGCGDGKCTSGETCPMDCDPVYTKSFQCVWSTCPSQMAACGAKKDCVDFYNCLISCKCDTACMESKCTSMALKVQAELTAMAQCAQQKECPDPCASSGPKCGNGMCEAGETPSSCPADCKSTGPKCGNGTCEAGESSATCPADCKSTGSHVCDQYCGKGAPGGCYCDSVCLDQKDCCTADGKGKAATCAGSTCGECNGAPPPP
ncbi:MAG: hypothetical protein FJ100_01380 [Deltaproteobacteria bacterium]|nr:hypothetical protein [Deltaproteobacteria bacterium]